MSSLEQYIRTHKLLPEETLKRASDLAAASRRSLLDTLVDEQFLDEAVILEAAAAQHHLEFVRLADLTIEPAAIKLVPAKLAAHYGVVPVRIEDGVLTLAVSSPLDTAPADDIESTLGCHVERVVACRQDILAALHRYYGVGAETVERILAETPERTMLDVVEESHDLEKMAADASVVRLVNQLFQEAIEDRATDIHFEMHRGGVRARRRIDGEMYDTVIPENIRTLYPAIVSRIKLMSNLDIVERRLPQDGRARVRIGHREYDLRISVVPAMHGEDIVVRILPATMLFDLRELGFGETETGALQELITRPHGIIFVTGPTGSGKSTTLYACLSQLNTRDKKIITIEDPVEYELEGITQTQIRPQIGLTFARALRSMLRHDPDVMMVGEVRDRETADIAIQTAMTGHLVLSTLHTNDAAGGATRLVDMGIEPYLITSTVLVFMAQRLVRVICPNCREPAEWEGRKVYRGRGCRRCLDRGYRGRMAISEFLPLVPEIRASILARASAPEIRERATALGMQTLAENGWVRVSEGATTVEEILRVTAI